MKPRKSKFEPEQNLNLFLKKKTKKSSRPILRSAMIFTEPILNDNAMKGTCSKKCNKTNDYSLDPISLALSQKPVVDIFIFVFLVVQIVSFAPHRRSRIPSELQVNIIFLFFLVIFS